MKPPLKLVAFALVLAGAFGGGAAVGAATGPIGGASTSPSVHHVPASQPSPSTMSHQGG